MRQKLNRAAATQHNRTDLISARAGFSLVELLLVLVIGAILMTFAVPGFTRMTASRNAQNARDNLVWMAARARAKAIERGRVYLLTIDPTAERARIIQRGATTALDSVTFSTEFKTTISTDANTTIVLCYSPRGYALACDSGSPSTNVDVTFTFIDKTAVARVKPLGQIERL
jgi:prepilin-type N-terminal cleavage/methylation domain-containing protein